MPVRLLYGATLPGAHLQSSDLLWKTKFIAPHPFFFCEFDDHSIMFANTLEIERAKKEAKDCIVAAIEPFMQQAHSQKEIDGLIQFLQLNTRLIDVPGDMPSGISKRLHEEGFLVSVHDGAPWYPERVSKTLQEIEHIAEVQGAMEKILSSALDMLREAEVSSDGMLKTKMGTVLTSELVREYMDVEFARLRCSTTAGITIACGIMVLIHMDHGADPHERGTGPLRANLPIVIDIFPQSKDTSYWSDKTRTVFKGKPSTEAAKMYQAVLDAQCLAIDMVHADVDGLTIQNAVEEFFKKNGWRTGNIDGKEQGFTHSVGHGVGLDLHEPPRITRFTQILSKGATVTVEPGLYYYGIGGVRIEDLVVVEKNGARNLTQFPKELEEMIL